MGSSSRGWIVALASAASKVSNGVRVNVGEGVSEGELTVPVAVITEIGLVGMVADRICVGCPVEPIGAHPTKARTWTKARDNKDNGFIFAILAIVPGP